jgi:tRNA pseudouridine55 synthase
VSRIERRAIDGILLLDKPGGMSSNAALQKVRYLLRAKKGGHTGSLDPLATGLLPLCFGQATKVSGFLLDADKRYRVLIRLGKTTTTGDREGEVLETRPFDHVSRPQVEAALADFRGEIKQVPPMYSALKHQGQRLYQLARQGVEVERPARTVHIYDLTLVDFTSGRVELDVHCSKGTYVRSLAEDLGETLGCGAHVEELRRTGLGPFDAGRMLTLSQIEALTADGADALGAALLPVDRALEGWPAVELGQDAAFYIRQGQAVFCAQGPAGGLVRIYGPGSAFIGMGEVLDDGRLTPKRLLSQPA